MAEQPPTEEPLEEEEPPTDAPPNMQEMLPLDQAEIRNANFPPKLQAALTKNDPPEAAHHTIQFMEDVPMRMFAEVARAAIPLRDILSWKKGSIVKFDKIIGEPIEILIGEQLLARGEVVVINNRFGIRISEITHPDEKIGDSRP